MRHDEIKGLLAAHALGSVPPEEKREIDIHLMSCAECRAEVADHEAVTSSLAMAVSAEQLPPGFKDRVMAAAVGDRAEAPSTGRERRSWRSFGLLTGIAVVAAVIAIGATVIGSNNDAERRRDVLALLASNNGIELAGEGDVIGRVSGSKFALAGVGAAPDGKTYQLWLMRGDDCPSEVPAGCDLVSAGTFDVEDGVALVDLEQSAAQGEDAAVTIENEGGVPFPTSEPLVHSL